MIDKTRIIDTVCERLEKLPLGHYIDLKTYKRNRTVIIVKIDEKKLLVIEDGYFKVRNQVYLKLFTAQVIALTGTGLSTIALALLPVLW
jgi:hypothetical protein